MYTPETQARLVAWRRAAVEGTLTQADLKQAIMELRQERKGAAVASETSRTTAAKAALAIPNGDDLMADLFGAAS